MGSTVKCTTSGLLAALAVLAFAACAPSPASQPDTAPSTTPATAAPTPTATAADDTTADGTSEPATATRLTATATQIEWCTLIDASWDAYFGHGEDAAAVKILQAADALEPESFGRFESQGVHTRRIDRDVRFIDGGPDSQYIEYTTNGCWDWAEAVGADIGDKAVDPVLVL